MSFFDLLLETSYEILKYFPIILIITFLFLRFVLKVNFSKIINGKAKGKKITKHENDFSLEAKIRKEKDFFGLEEMDNEEEFKKDVLKIMETVNHGKEIKVPFAKAFYILKNFKNYNVFSFEDGRIVFDKLKEIIDKEQNIYESDEQKNVEGSKTEAIPEFKQTVEKLEDGTFKISNPNGWTITEGNVIIDSFDINEQLIKVEDEIKKEKSRS